MSSKKTNDEWGVKGYQNTRVFNEKLDKPTVYSIPKDSGKPRDMITMIQQKKAYIPGPIYDITQSDIGKKGKFFIPKGKIPNYIGKIQSDAKKLQAFGKYDPIKKHKILGYYNKHPSESGSCTDDAIFQGMQTPSPSQYTSVDLNKIKKRSFAVNIVKPKEGETRSIFINSGDKTPGPSHYWHQKVEDSYKKTQTTKIVYGVPQTKKSSITDEIAKRKSVVPGVGKYNIDNGYKMLTLGARKGYK